MGVNYSRIINQLIHDPLYAHQPLKRIIITFDNKISTDKKPLLITTQTDNHGYEYLVINGKLEQL